MAPQHDATERTLHAAVGVDPTVIAGSPPSLEDPAADGAPLERGRLLGRYILLDRLGSGGMGAVYVAYDPELDRKVAIKVMHAGPGVDASADKRARLLREAQAMARLTHPNVVAIYDVGTFEDQVFIAMELIDGETLGDWLKRARPSWPEVVQIFIAAGRGLEAAHQADIVHRDFKPDKPTTPHPNAPQPSDRLQSHEFGRSGGGGVFSRRAGFCRRRSPPGKTQAKSSGAIMVQEQAAARDSCIRHGGPLPLNTRRSESDGTTRLHSRERRFREGDRARPLRSRSTHSISLPTRKM
jgi:hypothetical protein